MAVIIMNLRNQSRQHHLGLEREYGQYDVAVVYHKIGSKFIILEVTNGPWKGRNHGWSKANLI